MIRPSVRSFVDELHGRRARARERTLTDPFSSLSTLTLVGTRAHLRRHAMDPAVTHRRLDRRRRVARLEERRHRRRRRRLRDPDDPVDRSRDQQHSIATWLFPATNTVKRSLSREAHGCASTISHTCLSKVELVCFRYIMNFFVWLFVRLRLGPSSMCSMNVCQYMWIKQSAIVTDHTERCHSMDVDEG